MSAARIFVIASSIAASNADPELDPSGAAPAAALVDAAAAADDSDRRTGALLESETSRGRFRFRLGRVERISEWQQRSLRRGVAPPFYRPFSEPKYRERDAVLRKDPGDSVDCGRAYTF